MYFVIGRDYSAITLAISTTMIFTATPDAINQKQSSLACCEFAMSMAIADAIMTRAPMHPTTVGILTNGNNPAAQLPPAGRYMCVVELTNGNNPAAQLPSMED